MNFYFFIIPLVFACLVMLWQGRWRMVTPAGYFGYTVILYYLFKMVWNYVFNVDHLFDLKWEDFVFPFVILSCAMLLVSTLTARSSKRISSIFINPQKLKVVDDDMHLGWIFIILFLTLPLATILLGYRVLGEWPWSAPVLFRAFIQSGGMMYIYIVNMMLVQIAIVVAVKSVFLNKKAPPAWFFIGFPISLLYALNTGFTSSVLMIFFPAVMYLIFRKGWRLELILPILLPILIFYTFAHSLYKTGQSESMSSAVLTMKDNPDWDYGFFNRLDYPEQYVRATNFTLNDAEADRGNILGAIVQPIPRAFWQDKPLTYSSYMTKSLTPQNFYAGITANFGGLTEMMNAAGVLGIFLAIILWTLLFMFGNKIYVRACCSDWWFLFYTTVVLQIIGSSLIVAFFNDLGTFNTIINYILIIVFTGKIWPRFRIKEQEHNGALSVQLRPNVPIKTL